MPADDNEMINDDEDPSSGNRITFASKWLTKARTTITRCGLFIFFVIYTACGAKVSVQIFCI